MIESVRDGVYYVGVGLGLLVGIIVPLFGIDYINFVIGSSICGSIFCCYSIYNIIKHQREVKK